MTESTRTEEGVPVSGLSYSGGVVTLAWNCVVGGSKNSDDGENVTLHEFAHQLDQEQGASNGMPFMKTAKDSVDWIDIVGQEYDAFIKKIKRNHHDVIDDYGATNPAEFFAVTTETFFEKPKQLLKSHPDLFKEFSDYYECDPREWK